MAIIKPFMASRKFTATIGDGTGATFAIAATTLTDDTGAAKKRYCVLYLL
ncbi:hypothetical protein [Peribacillus frigoritolerans]